MACNGTIREPNQPVRSCPNTPTTWSEEGHPLCADCRRGAEGYIKREYAAAGYWEWVKSNEFTGDFYSGEFSPTKEE